MKKMILIKKVLQLFFVFCFISIPAMQEEIDGIVVAVEDKIILKSDVILNMQLSGISLSQNDFQLEKLYNDFLNQMINDNVLLVAAENDTNVVVDDNMVALRLNEYLTNVIQEVGSEENLTRVFNKSIREIKYYYRKQIYDAMLREIYVYNYLGDLGVSRKEVEVFYNIYRDSLPIVPTKYDFSLIEIPVMVNQEEVNRVKNFQINLLKRLNKGEDFGELAEQFSEDPGTASNGGNQGYYQRGTLFPEFEEIAFNLEINEISKPIRTPVGFHIIKLLDKKDNTIQTQHILNLITKSENDYEDELEILNKIYNNIINDPGAFDSLAISYNKIYNNRSGIYTNIPEDQLPDEIRSMLINGREYVLSKPVTNSNKSICSMIYPYKVNQSSVPTLTNSWEEIELYAKNKKQAELLNKLLEKLKNKTFIKYYN